MKTLVLASITISALTYTLLMQTLKEQRKSNRNNHCSLYLTKKSERDFVPKPMKQNEKASRLDGYTDFSGGTWGI